MAETVPSRKTAEKTITTKLTQKLCSSTAAAAYERVELRDSATPGLSLRISGPSGRRADGAKSWYLVYRVGESAEGGKTTWTQSRMKLGDFPGTDLDRARELAEEHKRVARAGMDPQTKLAADAAAFNAEQVKAANRQTVESVLKEYLAHGMAGRAPTYKGDVASKFKRLVYPEIGSRYVDEIDGQDISELVGKVSANNGPVAANRLLTAIKRAFNWTVAQRPKWLKSNPADKLERPNPESSDSRALTDAELPHIWKAADRLGYPCGDALKIMLLTGQRRGDVSAMRFKHLDLDVGTWTQPKWIDRAAGKGGNKARRRHHLPLSPAAVAILRRLKEEMAKHPGRKPGDDHVFVERTGRPLENGWHAGQPKLRELANEIARQELEHWEVEFSRHTMRTRLSRKPISAPEIVGELILNHAVPDKLTATYNQHDFIEEMGESLAKWERQLLAIVEPGEDKAIKHRQVAG